MKLNNYILNLLLLVCCAVPLYGMTPEIDQCKMNLIREKGLTWYYLWRCIPNERCVNKIVDYVKPDLTDEHKHFIESSMNVLYRKFKGFGSSINGIKFNDDSTKLVFRSGKRGIKLLDLQTGKCCGSFKTDAPVTSLAFNPDNTQLASGLIDGTIIIWDLQKNQSCNLFKEHNDPVLAVKFDSSGKRLVSESRKNIKIWKLETDEHSQGSWSRGRNFLYGPYKFSFVKSVESKNKIIKLNYAGTLHVDRSWYAHCTPIRLLKFSPDNHYLVSVSDVGTIRVWDIDRANNLVRKLFRCSFTLEDLKLIIERAKKQKAVENSNPSIWRDTFRNF